MNQSAVMHRVQGIFLVILGVLAILWPTISSIAVEIIIGWLFLIGGIIKFIKSIRTKAYFAYYLIALAYAVVGGFLLIYPIQGTTSLTLALAILFVVQGILEIIWGFSHDRSRALFIVGGILSLILGIILWMRWPGDSRWAIGLIAGINFIATGIVEILYAKKLAKRD